MSIVTPLYGHTSEETAYLVESYPYGGLRCKKKYWIESHPKKGFRLVTRTENPKTFRWNAPDKGTYVMFAACMYLDEKGHTTWACLNNGSGAKETLSFIESFPGADLSNIKVLVVVRLQSAKRTSEGKANYSIGGVPQLPSEYDIEKAKEEMELWQKCLDALKPKTPQCDTPDGTCINSGACNAADKCIRPKA
jgi:hypothetical protein